MSEGGKEGLKGESRRWKGETFESYLQFENAKFDKTSTEMRIRGIRIAFRLSILSDFQVIMLIIIIKGHNFSLEAIPAIPNFFARY